MGWHFRDAAGLSRAHFGGRKRNSFDPEQSRHVSTATARSASASMRNQRQYRRPERSAAHLSYAGIRGYEAVAIAPAKGERIFCSEGEAVTCGWRKGRG